MSEADKTLRELTRLVDLYKTNPLLELEGALGVWRQQKFESGVPFEHFECLFNALSDPEPGVWTRPFTNNHFACYFYPDGVRGTYSPSKPPEFVRKSPVSRADVDCGAVDLRFSLKEEKPVLGYESSAAPTFVRLQDRWSFYRGPWRYDLTKVQSGATLEEAVECDAAVFEVELELARSGGTEHETELARALLNRPSPLIARHLYEKTCDLLGRFTAGGDEVQFAPVLQCRSQ
jgi:hypothetical protein